MRTYRPMVTGAIIFILVAPCAAFLLAQFSKSGAAAFVPEFQKGMTYATWDKDALGASFSDASLDVLAGTGTEWVAFVPTWYQPTYDSTELAPTPQSPTDASLVHAIQQAHAVGLRVMLKPQVDLSEESDISWRGEIDFADAAGWDAWFESYKRFVRHYAKIAQDEGVELFCVGTELTTAAWHEAAWRDVIDNVRAIYAGPLTYAANWDEEYQFIKFWDALDYAGLDPYFSLSGHDRPTLEELLASWETHAAEIERWQQAIQKPVIFTEIGYRSIDGAARAPWETGMGAVNPALQHDCYLAALQTFWDRPWFYGLYWWHWGTHKNMGKGHHRGFTPQNKPAETLVREWYAKER